MEGVGLRLLDGADLAPSFATTGVLPQAVAARISLSKFVGVNTVRGRWALVDALATTPLPPSAPVAAAPPSSLAARQEVQHVTPATQPAATQPAAPQLLLEQLEKTVHSVAAEVLGASELDSSGHFPAGGMKVRDVSGPEGSILGSGLMPAAGLCFHNTSLPTCPTALPQVDLTAWRQSSCPTSSAKLWDWTCPAHLCLTIPQLAPWLHTCSPGSAPLTKQQSSPPHWRLPLYWRWPRLWQQAQQRCM